MKKLLARIASIAFCALLPFSAKAAPTLTLSAPSIANDAVVAVHYNISGISPGETVTVERFLDVDNNGVITDGTPLISSFRVTDGVAPSVGGVRNRNVPGDDDAIQSGAIRVELPFPGVERGTGRMPGRFLVRVTAASGQVTQPFEVTQANLPQRINGVVRNASNNSPIPFAAIALVANDGPVDVIVVADASGAFSIATPPGYHGLFGAAEGFIATGNSAFVTVPAGQTVTHDVLLTPVNHRIRGQLRDAAGAPVPAQFVISERETFDDFFISFGLTDASGNFELSANGGGWELHAYERSAQLVPGIPNWSFVQVSGADVTQNISLAPATALIYGRLTRSTGEPLPGLGLWAELMGNDEDEVQTSSITPNGDYFLAVSPGMWEVGPEDADLAARGLRPNYGDVNVAAGQAAQLNLSFGATTAVFAGRVVDQDNQPVVGVFFHGHYGDNGDSWGIFDTGPNGEFEIPVWGGNWRFHIGDDAAENCLLESQLDNVTVVDGVDQRNVIYDVIRADRTISGNVRNSSGQPLSGVGVNIYGVINGTDYSSYIETDLNGQYSLCAVNGTWWVSLDCWDLQQRGLQCPSSVQVTVNNNNPVRDFNVSPEVVVAHLRGRLVDQNGNPFSGVTVCAFGNGPSRQSTTDGNGNFDIGISSTGNWCIELCGNPPPGMIAPERCYQVQSGVDINNIELRLRAASQSISGFVRTSGGQPIPNLTVHAETQIDGVFYHSRSQTGSQGAFSLDVFNGSWWIWVDCWPLEQQGLQCPPDQFFDIQNAGATHNFIVSAPEVDAHLRGRVVDQDGNPLAGIQLGAWGGPGPGRTVTSDGSGFFDIGVTAGNWSLGIWGEPPAGYSAPYLFFQVQDGVDINNIDFRLRSTNRTISGQVRTSGGQPVGDLLIWAYAEVNGTEYQSSTRTDGQGQYSVPVFDTAWTLSLDCFSLEQRGLECLNNIDVIVQGSNVTRDIIVNAPNVTAHLRGRAVDERGNAISSLNLVAVPTEGPDRRDVTDFDGVFDIGVFGGTWSLQVNGPPPGGYVAPVLSFSVQDGVDMNNIVFRLMDVDRPIIGTLRNAQGQPLQGVWLHANATINEQFYSVWMEGGTDFNGGFSLPAIFGTWNIYFDCNDLQSRGYLCPPTVVHTLTANSGPVEVVVSTSGGGQDPSVGSPVYTRAGQSAFFEFTVSGEPGTYDVLVSDTLNPGSWNNTGVSVTIQSGQNSVRATLSTTAQRSFYKVQRREGGGDGFPAPVGLSQIRFIHASGPFAGSDYTVSFTGGSSGTFTIISGSEGRGTFTYTPSGNSGRLVMVYDMPGESDDLTLNFRAGSGSPTASIFSGTITTGGVNHTGSGTFTYTAP